MEVNEVFALSKSLLDAKEKLYGEDSWRELGLSGCLEAANRKAIYLKAQMTNGQIDTPKFREDLLDLINWAAFTYCLSVRDSDYWSSKRLVPPGVAPKCPSD